MASKRQLESGPSDSDEPQAKRPTVICPPISIGPISSLEEMDIKVLQFQNKKLWERIESRRQAEAELRGQMETMEAKQTATDATLSLVNRYWDQLDENIKVTLQRLSVYEVKQDYENSSQDEEDIKKKSFHRLLSDSEFQDIKGNVSNRLECSRDSFAKIVDAIIQEKEKNSVFNAIEHSEYVDVTLKNKIRDLEENNKHLQQLTTSLQAEHHKFSLERSTLEDKIEGLEERVEELQDTAETARWELKKTRSREDRLTRRLAETLEKLKKGVENENGNGNTSASTQDATSKDTEKVQSDDGQILAESRLKELENFKAEHQKALKELEKLQTDIRNIPENIIFQTTEYRTLKSQFSVLYHESVQMKQLLDESRSMLQLTRNNHLRRIDQMECDELQTQKKLRNELIQLEDTLAKVRHDYEALHAELEQNLAANEQAGPVNREMRHLINSLQNHNRQLKRENQRYKKKVSDLQHDIAKTKQADIQREDDKQESQDGATPSSDDKNEKSDAKRSSEKDEIPPSAEDKLAFEEKIDAQADEIEKLNEQLKTYEAELRELKLLLDMYKGMSKEQREKAEIMASEKEARMHFGDLEDQVSNFKMQISSLEEENESLKSEIASKTKDLAELIMKLSRETERANQLEEKHPRGPDPETLRKIKVLEETIAEQRKNLAATKQEEEALLSEMDVTGQAFEDMQEQNMRLLQQLREKDDANFKLMSERIKANQVQKLLQEEKLVLQDQSATLQLQVEAQNQVVRRLEEKEGALQNTLATVEKEMSLRCQAMDLHKRKAVEMTQVTEDIKRELEKYKGRVVILEESMDRKVESLEEEHFKLSRMQEEGAKLRRKLEKHKKTEGLYSADEVLMEEIKEYKTKLRCPCCNVNNKDAVLTKCYHVFCIKCIKTRYDTRQRKCPKCNAGFGGNDFHRIYIE
ncbi:E3 ubiquitin-protein ligase BRE1A-like [Clavelina lepadiformis]|uniref:E3 ubiquitin-protein ligase BRE1A-like n=1 Tax=Clavelina lepadiformis TaxID=159417 RepID=UPI00404220A4